MITKKTIKKNHLIEASNLLVERFKTPEKFLEFISESIYWVGVCKKKNEEINEDMYLLKLMISEIVQPWLKNASHITSEIEHGITRVHDHSGSDGLHGLMTVIMQGLAIDLADCCYEQSQMRGYLSAINTMFEIHYCLQNFESKLRQERELETIAEAA